MFFSQVPSFKWARGVKEFTHLWNGPTDIKTDASGNVYVVGRFKGIKDFDPGFGVFNIGQSGPGGGSDIFILKLDSLGNFLWVKHIGGKQSEFAGNLELDTAGNILLAGNFHDTVDFDPGPGTYTLTSSVWNAFILKLNSNGDFVFVKQIPANLGGMGLALDVNNNILVTGSFSAPGDFDPGPGIFNLNHWSNGDSFILKLDENGDFVWAKAFGGAATDGGTLISADAMGNVFAAGHFQGTCYFSGANDILTSAGEFDIYMLKLSSSGNFQWVRGISGAGYDRLRSIKIDASNNLLAVGLFSVTCDIDPGPGVITFTAPVINTFILKLSNAGDHVWSKQLGDSAINEPGGAFLDASDNIYTIGPFNGTGDFDPGPSTSILSSQPNGNSTYLSKLDSNGNCTWTGCLAGLGSVTGIAVAGSGEESFFITGLFNGTADLNPGMMSDSLNWEPWEENMFIAGYGKCNQPSAPALKGSISELTICAGESTSISVAGTGTVSWYNSQYGNTVLGTGNSFVTPPLTVTSTYYADDNTNCARSSSRTAVTVSVIPLPTISVTASPTIACVGDWVTLTASGAVSYTYGSITNNNTFIEKPLNHHQFPYAYSIYGTDVNGCLNSGVALVYTKVCTEIEESDNDGLKVYPVPCNSELNIEKRNPGITAPSEITIMNAVAQVVKQEQLFFNGTTAVVDVSGLSPGFYFCKLGNGTSSLALKIFIGH